MGDKEVNLYGDKTTYVENLYGSIYQGVDVSSLTSEKIISDFALASTDLSGYDNQFANKIHIPKVETQELFNWILSDIQPSDSPIAILAGNAGCGKSVILRDLFDILRENEIPVLGIKADRLCINNIKDLNNELQLSDSIESIFKKLSTEVTRFVLLIDQIDALSQSLSSDRNPLNTYHRLVSRLSNILNIRIVISCRMYDLDYDPTLQEYRKKKIIKTSLLSSLDVNNVLNAIGIEVSSSSGKLNEFLRLPLHLQLFCKTKVHSKFDNTIKLQDLYDEIWEELILQKPRLFGLDSENVRNLVKDISGQMYYDQRLIVNKKKYEDEYINELNYLSSEELITKPERNKIQFIHQSFFDYAYARTFVEKGMSISDSLKEQHQGLFVRSRVKQVFSYLREFDSSLYIKELENVISGENRFHLKLLLIHDLGFYSDPLDEEKHYVKDKLSKIIELFYLFTESIYTPEWFRFLIKDIDVLSPIKTNNDKYINAIYMLCHRMASICPDDIIDFLYEINKLTFDKKEIFMGNILSALPCDSIYKSIPLYHDTKSGLVSYNFHRYLETAVVCYPDFVIEELRTQLDYALAHLDKSNLAISEYIPGKYESSNIYKSLYEKHPQKSIPYFIEVIRKISDFSRIQYEIESRKDRYFDSWAYFLYTPNKDINLYFHQDLYDLTISFIEKLFISDFEKAKELIMPLLNSDLSSIINIPVTFFARYPENFLEPIFTLFCEKKVFNSSSELLLFNLRELLKVSYKHLSSDNQSVLNDMILSVSPEWEKGVLGKGVTEYGHTRIGYTAYSFISMIPEEERKKYYKLNSFYKEKNRQYGKYKHEEPKGIETKVGYSALDKRAYELMTDDQWILSFKTYTNNSNSDWNVPDMHGHCHMFEEYVSLKPERYIALINNIIDDEEVLSIYCVYGLQGLKKANFNPTETKKLFMKLVSKREDVFKTNMEAERESLQYLVWLTDYFIDNSIVDPDIIGFLTDLVKNYPDEKALNTDDPLLDGINRIRGAASNRLVLCYKFPQYKDNIFEALEIMSDNGAVHTRAAALYQLALLNNLDKDRNLNLFLKLMHDYNPNLLGLQLNNLHPLLYLIHVDFSKLIDFFNVAIEVKESQKTISCVLFFAWLHDYNNSKELLEKILNSSVIAKQSVVRSAFEAIGDKRYTNKCWVIINNQLDNDDKDLGQVYETAFIRLPSYLTPELELFLDKYVHSNIGKFRGHYFYEILAKVSKDIPDKCIKWSLLFENHEKPNIQERMLSNEPLQVVIQSYNAIRKYDKENKSLESAMDAFDRMLLVPEYRGYAIDILQRIDA